MEGVNAPPRGHHQDARKVTYRECYISLAQNEVRSTSSVRFPLVAKGCTTSTEHTLEQLLRKMQPLLCENGTITIHAASAEEAIFSLTDDHDARFVHTLLTSCEDAVVDGAVIKFTQWKPTHELGFDVTEQRVHVSITGLPLQLRTPAAVDYILSPYCALEYITQNTAACTDLVNYKCIAWSQQRIPIPGSILICIPVTTPDDGQLMENQTYRRMLTYQITLDLHRYIHGQVVAAEYVPPTHVPRYEHGYNTNNAICFMPPELVDKEFMQQLSTSIVATCTTTQAQLMHTEIHQLHPELDQEAITVRTISPTQQLIMLPGGNAGLSMQQTILTTQLATVLQLQPWSPATGSVEDTLHVCARLTIHRVPAHFCTQPLMQLLIGGSAYMEVPDRNAEKLITSETYRCIVWCNDPAHKPHSLLAKAVSADMASTLALHSDPDVTLRTASMLINIQHIASSIHDLLTM